MPTPDEDHSLKISVVEEGQGKPIINSSGKTKFRTGDAVYLLTGNGSTREGPYVVNDVLLSTKSYTLTLEDGRDVKDGAAIKESTCRRPKGCLRGDCHNPMYITLELGAEPAQIRQNVPW